MMTKFTTVNVQRQRCFVFKDPQLSYLARLRSRQIVVLVSMLPEFAQQSRLLCRVSVDFGSRLRSMVPLSKSFHNVAIFGQCFKTTGGKQNKIKKKKKDRLYEKEKRQHVWKEI